MNFGVKDYVVVPDQAVVKQSGAGDRFIYVYKDGKVSYNKVEIGRQLGTTYEVISGVEVVTRSLLPVKAVWQMEWKLKWKMQNKVENG